MNWSIIRYITGWVLLLEGAFLFIPMVTSLVYAETTDALVFCGCATVAAALGFLMKWKKPKSNTFFAREGFVATALSWLVLSLVGAMPFWISGAIPSFVDALFETVSGFTTTGASILTDVESLHHGMLLWRSFSHWIGGMGVLVFMLAILPSAGGNNMYLMKAESPGPTVSKLVPNLRKTAAFLYVTYFFMTVVQFVLMITVGQMPVFDALCMTFGTAGTGGFGVKADSFGSYTVAAQIITTVFMILFGVNFNAYFLLFRKRFKEFFQMEELRWYFGLYFGVSLLIILNLVFSGGDVALTVKDVLFQTASVMTTTGYSTVDFNLWPTVPCVLMLVLMCVGACAGSTGGGFKVARVALLFKSAGKEMSRMLHPRSVKVIKSDGKAVERETMSNLHAYLFCYVVILVLMTVLVALDGFDFKTTFTSVIATFNNIGPGLGEVGPMGSFAAFSPFAKLVFTFGMLAGRLEIFPLLLLFAPATWKK